jgi:hypothetical protein
MSILKDMVLVAHNEAHAQKLRTMFPGTRVIINKPIPMPKRSPAT